MIRINLLDEKSKKKAERLEKAAAAMREYYHKNKSNPEYIAKRRKITATWLEKVKDTDEYKASRKRTQDRANDKNVVDGYYEKYWADHKDIPGWKERGYARTRAWRLNLKREVFAAYGNKCACCGESTFEFLSIDHINGGGTKHRETIHGGSGIFAEIKREGFPKDKYRILCFNCNCARGFMGFCPHERKETQA